MNYKLSKEDQSPIGKLLSDHVKVPLTIEAAVVDFNSSSIKKINSSEVSNRVKGQKQIIPQDNNNIDNMMILMRIKNRLIPTMNDG